MKTDAYFLLYCLISTVVGQTDPSRDGRGQYWAMDFDQDQLANGRKFRVLTAIDKWHRQRVAPQADCMPAGRGAVDVMNKVALSRQPP